MSCKLIGGLILVGGVFVAMAVSTTSLAGGKKKDGDVSRYMKQLEARFQAWDDNSDNKLDKAELARAFRGPKAKPYDTPVEGKPVAAAPPKPAPERKVKPVHVALVTLPQHSLFGNTILAEVLSRPAPTTTKAAPPQPSSVVPNYSTFPDFQFLTLVSKNNDGTISHQEFDNWAKSYARMLDSLEDAQAELNKANAKLQNAKGKGKVLAQQDVQKHQQEVRAANAKLDAIPPAIHKALKVRP